MVPAHRAYTADVADDYPLTVEQSEQMKASLRMMDAKAGNAVHYGLGDEPIAVRSLWAPTIRATLRIDGGRDVHPPAFLHLLGRESWRSPAPSALSLVPLQTCLYPFAGGLHLEGRWTSIILRKSLVATLKSAVLMPSDGHDADVLLVERRLDGRAPPSKASLC